MKLVKLVLDVRRSSALEGSFVVNDEEWDFLQQIDGCEINLGEVAGKHSEVIFEFSIDDLEILSEDPVEIEIVQRLLGDSFGFHWKRRLIDYMYERAGEDGYMDFHDDISIEDGLKDRGYLGQLAECYKTAWEETKQDADREEFGA